MDEIDASKEIASGIDDYRRYFKRYPSSLTEVSTWVLQGEIEESLKYYIGYMPKFIRNTLILDADTARKVGEAIVHHVRRDENYSVDNDPYLSRPARHAINLTLSRMVLSGAACPAPASGVPVPDRQI